MAVLPTQLTPAMKMRMLHRSKELANSGQSQVIRPGRRLAYPPGYRAVADHIGTSRQTVHAIIAGRTAVREAMAVRLARTFKTTPQVWLNLQSNHVVWELERLHRLDRICPLKKRGGQRPRGTQPISGRGRVG